MVDIGSGRRVDVEERRTSTEAEAVGRRGVMRRETFLWSGTLIAVQVDRSWWLLDDILRLELGCDIYIYRTGPMIVISRVGT